MAWEEHHLFGRTAAARVLHQIQRGDMPNEHGEYTNEERARYEREALCPECEQPRDVEWRRSNPGSSGELLYVPGLETCTTPDCRRNPNRGLG